jgi:hypothetical protein
LFKMRDICGKFQIGDTITFTKVKAYKTLWIPIRGGKYPLVQTNSHK